jgi:hypothetical protein
MARFGGAGAAGEIEVGVIGGVLDELFLDDWGCGPVRRQG